MAVRRHFNSVPLSSIDERAIHSPKRRPIVNIELTHPTLVAPQSLAGKVAIVTGSTSGIGLGIVRAFASAGASVVLNGFGLLDAINRTLTALQEETGAKAIYSAADMTKPQEIADMVATTLEAFDRLDILVNNAGIQHVSP